MQSANDGNWWNSLGAWDDLVQFTWRVYTKKLPQDSVDVALRRDEQKSINEWLYTL